MRLLVLLSFLASAVLFPAPGMGAFKSVKEDASLETAWNPRPLADDIKLPMPCGLSMALRAVIVPSGALLRDKTFTMGISSPQNQDRQIYERQFMGHISAPFTKADLPAEWQGKAGAGQKTASGDTWYFIGKYEVSRMQWDAVMNALTAEGEENPAMCPAMDARSALPVSGVSWFEAQDFLNKYNAWLIKYHRDILPSFQGTRNIAFCRLPTEEEWEYAARGGASVPPEWWENQDFFPLRDGNTVADYGVFNAGTVHSEAMPIGSRLANPLGLHDAAGNVSEMVDGFFRMSIADMRDGRVERRLHGAAGGILTKGGSFRSSAGEVMPGSRDEAPLYTAAGPGRQNDLGLRLVLAGLNIPTAQRLDELKKEVAVAPVQEEKRATINVTAQDTPLETVKKLEQGADAVMKPVLQDLRMKMQDQINAESVANSKRVAHTFRSLLYQAETLRAFAFRFSYVTKDLEKMASLLKTRLSANDEKTLRKLIAEAKKDRADYLQSLEMGASYYKTSLGVLLDEPEAELKRLAAQARQEYGGAGVFNEHMRQNIAILEKNLAEARKAGLTSLQTDAILKGILPDSHYKLLSQK